jgi:copper chaperone CopZ
MTTAQLHVKGMSCMGCAQSVERRLRKAPGVHNAAVDLASAIARVTFDDTQTTLTTLESAVTGLGFEVDYSVGADVG